MSARTDRRRTGLSRERLIVLLLLALAVIVAVTAARLHFSGSLTLDALLVELGLKPPTVAVEDIPAYSGEPYVVLQDNQPDFGLEDLTLEPFETYSELDYLGRCGVAYANICLDIMPTEPRGDIGQVKPSGRSFKSWNTTSTGIWFSYLEMIFSRKSFSKDLRITNTSLPNPPRIASKIE